MATTRRKLPGTLLPREGNLSDRIYAEVRQRLQLAPLGPEDRLIDLEVAEAYGTSRMPARDALLRLANEGYLVGTTRGFVVPTLTPDDVREIFEVRRLLEPQAIASVARTIDAAAIEELSQALLRARKAASDQDGDEMMQANMAFRRAWLSRVGNQRLAATIARFVDHVQTVRLHTLSDAEARKVVMDGLEFLYAALLNRDEAQARARMTDFIVAAEHAFFSIRRTEIEEADSAAPPAVSTPREFAE